MNHQELFRNTGWDELMSQIRKEISTILFILKPQNKKVLHYLEPFIRQCFRPVLHVLHGPPCKHFILMEKNY